MTRVIKSQDYGLFKPPKKGKKNRSYTEAAKAEDLARRGL
jgi:hypothetical protein